MNEHYKSNSKTQWNVIGKQRETDKESETQTVMTYKLNTVLAGKIQVRELLYKLGNS